MPGGRPITVPDSTLVAVRLSGRHMRLLRARMRREGVSLSEAIRRSVEEAVGTRWGRADGAARGRPSTRSRQRVRT